MQDARDALIRYATLVGDTEPVASIATQIASYSLRLNEPQLALRWIDRAMDEGGPTAALTALKVRAEATVRTQELACAAAKPRTCEPTFASRFVDRVNLIHRQGS